MLQWLLGGRKSILAKPVTQKELADLSQVLWQSSLLAVEQRHLLAKWMRVFISEKNWEGCNGLVLTDRMRQTVAASAGLMVLKYPGWFFDRSTTILLYPEPYVARTQIPVLETSFHGELGGYYYRAGETRYRGPVILNWSDVEAASSGHNHGEHLVVHEFSHQLNMINGPSADGLPPLPQGVSESVWMQAMKAEYEAAREMVAHGHRTLINDYGLSAQSEFFSVASELYFQRQAMLAQYHPKVYELLKQFYQIDLP